MSPPPPRRRRGDTTPTVVVADLEAPAVHLPLHRRLRRFYWTNLWHLSSLLFAAAWIWRRLLPRTRFVAITGALGKTTCKELTADLLASRFRTFRTPGNLNARAGVALNVLRVRPWHRYAVLEVAVGRPGEMNSLARVVRPDIAVVLCVKGTHTGEFTGGLVQHAAEKARLLQALRPGGIAVLNVDDPLVRDMAIPPGARLVRIGQAPDADVRAHVLAHRWPDRLALHVALGGHEQQVQTQLVGAHWLPSVTAAVAVGREAGVPLSESAEALSRTEPVAGRLQPLTLPNGAVVLRDDYNASVDGSAPAFEALAEARAVRRVLVLTDLSDTGVNRPKRLRALAEGAARVSDLYVIVGESAEYGAREAVRSGMSPAASRGFATLMEAAAFLRAELRAGDLVLLKGRTTDHAGRLFWAQLGPVACWRVHCPLRQVCDTCPELGAPQAPGAVRRPA